MNCVKFSLLSLLPDLPVRPEFSSIIIVVVILYLYLFHLRKILSNGIESPLNIFYCKATAKASLVDGSVPILDVSLLTLVSFLSACIKCNDRARDSDFFNL